MVLMRLLQIGAKYLRVWPLCGSLLLDAAYLASLGSYKIKFPSNTTSQLGPGHSLATYLPFSSGCNSVQRIT